jgi:putative tricarboxylic transport membrane protein
MVQATQSSDGAIPKRWPELGMAAVLMALAAVVIWDSLRMGMDWADDGPRAGYFPFYIGLVLLAASAVIAMQTLWGWHGAQPVFVVRQQWQRVLAVFVPMLLYVGFMGWLGLYVSSGLLMAYFMRRHGRYAWGGALALACAVPLVCFYVFERQFLVLLPKGPLEAWLGL